jgi:hypothetical protein
MVKICKYPMSIEKFAESANLKVKRTINGLIKVVGNNDEAPFGIFSTIEEARAAIKGAVGQNADELDRVSALPIIGPVFQALSQSPPGFQSTLTAGAAETLVQLRGLPRTVRGAAKALQVGPAAAITPIKKIAQAAEGMGLGPAFTEVYETTQRARTAFQSAMSADRPNLRALFGEAGKHRFSPKESSFQSVARQMQKESLDPRIGGKEEREWIVRWMEAKTKEELAAPGQLLMNGLSKPMIDVADEMSRLGIADDMWEMMRLNGIIDDLIVNREVTLNEKIPKLLEKIGSGELPPEFKTFVEGLVEAAGAERTVQEFMTAAGLTADQQKGMHLLRSIIDETEVYNIPAIYRYATAPVLKPGFKNGAEQYAAAMGMTKEAVALAEKRRAYLIEVIDSGAPGDPSVADLADTIFGAQLPVFREALKAGFAPGFQYGDDVSLAMKKWMEPLQDLVLGNELLGRRILSGLLNPNEFNPAVSAIQHARNILYREYMDPVMREAVEVARDIAKNGDERIGQFLINYLHEIEGLPTASFENLNKMLERVGKSLNIKVEKGVSQRLISTLNFLTYSSAIPFRPALIARNSFQTMLNIPIVGGEAWYHGVKTALGYGPDGVARHELAQAAGEYAIKVGAWKPDITPLHGGTDMIGSVGEGMFGGLSDQLQRWGVTSKEVFEVGFTAYRKPDDIGRVISLFAGKHRVNKALTKYREFAGPDDLVQRPHRITRRPVEKPAIEWLKEDAKVKTFDETIEAQFETLIRDNRWQEAEDLIGMKLADKVHFLYGAANHPPGWGSVPGKLFGQFGTFPVQYLSHVTESLTRGTAKDRMEFVAYHGAINLGIIAAGAELFDADLGSWAFYPSLTYTGGPYADLALNGISALAGSDAERGLAWRNIKLQFPTWNNPSIFIPGHHFFTDIVRGAQEDDILKGLFRATGVRFLEGREPELNDAILNVRTGFGWINE